MQKILKIELKRAFYNKLFLISVLIGCIITGMQIYQNVLPMMEYNVNTYVEMPPHSVFSKWIGAGFTFWDDLFFIIFPLLASIPFADSFYIDCKTGYVKNIFTRTKKSDYYLSKFIAVFLSGGTTVIIPLLLNLYLSALCLPSIIPDVTAGTFPIFSNSTGAAFFYTHPFLYVFLYMLLIFIVSGILVTIALAFSFLVNYQYVVTLTPFMCLIFISFVSMFFSNPSLDISQWIKPSQTTVLNFAVIIPEMLVLALFVIITYFQEVRNETN